MPCHASCLTRVRAVCAPRVGRSRYVSVEKSHNSVHGIVSGIMSSFQSSFHPVFWMHHNNVERFFTAYLAMNPDSHQEFYDHQARRSPDGSRGFPEGPYGPYLPFINHVRAIKGVEPASARLILLL